MELIQRLNSSSVQPDSSICFINACQELAQHIEACGYKSLAYNERGLNRFSSLPETQQLAITQALITYVQQIQSARTDKIDIASNNSKHAWWALNRMGLRTLDDVSEKIKSTDIIEIYNKDSIQVFRSFEMFKYLSYSLSEIFSHDWIELYSHDEFVFKRMFSLVQEVLTGKYTTAINPNFPPHVVSERFSDRKCWAKMKHRLFSPLYSSDGQIGGFLSAFEILDHGTINN